MAKLCASCLISSLQTGCQVPELIPCLSSTSAAAFCVDEILSLESLHAFRLVKERYNRGQISLLLGGSFHCKDKRVSVRGKAWFTVKYPANAKT